MKIWFVRLGGEYTFSPGVFVELNLNLQLGIGRAAQEIPEENVATTLFTFEPELTAGIEIMQFEKIKFGAGYRFAFTSKSVGDLTTKNLS